MFIINIVVAWIVEKLLDLIFLMFIKSFRNNRDQYKDHFEDRRRYWL
ncbi:hypothetical protein N399_08810 [Bacillus licheniformis CG-B52]|nr:hypothetical protein MUY_001557 [Bacillus licheniformis WX-02]EQM28428.1 hypothetical protein N399_08810 [Bacillus licheniformis CG-B52]